LKALYGVNDVVGSNSSGATQAVAGWEHQSYSPGDLQDFENHYDLPPTKITMVSGDNTGFPHMEANLDTQYITAMGEYIPTKMFLNSGFFSFDVLDWINAGKGYFF
jgi:subtilase family serine protease